LYHALNIFFFVFHLVLIVFNLGGWAFRKTRKLHFITIALTAFSWFGLGWFYGWGYCFLTDWHYDVRHELGLIVDSSSYIHFMLKRLGIDFWNEQTTNIITGVSFVAAVILTLWFNISDYIRAKRAQ